MRKKKAQPQLPPEIQKGIRIQYLDREGKLRAGRVHIRGKTIVITVDALKQHHDVKIERVKGYWKPKVRASPQNMIRLGVKV
jgi:hypothetical protein